MRPGGAILLALVLFFSAAYPAIVQAHWDDLGPAYVRVLFTACHRVAPAQRIVRFGTQLYSSTIEVSIFPECTGLGMIRTYSLLFAATLLLNWKRMQRPIHCLLFVAGIALLEAANFCRNVVMGIGRYEPMGLDALLVFAVLVVMAWPALMRKPSSSRQPPAAEE